jgi:S1-C subfamily serine protease
MRSEEKTEAAKEETLRHRRVPFAALIALALLAGTVGGGAAGTVLSANRLGPSSPPPIIAAQPVSAQSSLTTNAAGTVFKNVSSAVVQVVVSGQAPNDPTRYAGASGLIVDARGLILTNYHVVENARAVTVRFSNSVTREARVLGTDRGNDLALLKVDPTPGSTQALPEGVSVAPLGDSDQVEIGETAIAIGSPFGLDQTVTQGIVSALHRAWQPGDGRVRRNLIQTDAPLNPGNSGGPLLNGRGEVIGITSMIESPIRGSVGVGFAVPINLARSLLPQLEAGANLEPVWLGIAGQELDPAIARDQGLTVQGGVLVLSVVPDSPAARAGLRGGQGAGERIPRGGDVITAVDGVPIKDMPQLADQLAARRPGETIPLTIVRGGQELQLRVTLQPWPTGAR